MPLICPRCGTQNADGVRFCSNCAQSLEGVAPMGAAGAASQQPPATPPPAAPPPSAPPPPAPPPPPAAPPPYTPPPAGAYPPGAPPPGAYYAPAAAAPAPGKRLPMMLIIGGVVLALLLVAGVGVVLAMSGGGGQGQANQTVAPPTQAPVTQAPPDDPDPTAPPDDPDPTAPPDDPDPTAPPDGPDGPVGPGETVEVANIAVTVPGGWEAAAQDPAVIQVSGEGGLITFFSADIGESPTLDQLLDGLQANLEESFPDVQVCGDPSDSTLPNGPAGVFVAYCYTLTLEGGQSVVVADLYLISMQGTVLSYVEALTAAENLDAFLEASGPIVGSVQWRLL